MEMTLQEAKRFYQAPLNKIQEWAKTDNPSLVLHVDNKKAGWFILILVELPIQCEYRFRAEKVTEDGKEVFKVELKKGRNAVFDDVVFA